jgi:membrane-associated phospholipid phosphatase
VILFLVVSFFGGFMQFYIGVHTLADTIAGYLLGAAAASCAIGFLIIFDTRDTIRN